MHPRISELLQCTDRQRIELRSTVDEIPAARHASVPPAGGWSIVGILEHLSIVEGRVTALVRRKAAELRMFGGPPETDPSPILPRLGLDRFRNRAIRIEAPDAVKPTVGMTFDHAWDALDRSRRDFREAVLAVDGYALETVTAPHPVFGSIDLYTWIAFVGAHEARHTDQIREIGASLGDAV
jgi:hypothetical protein